MYKWLALNIVLISLMVFNFVGNYLIILVLLRVKSLRNTTSNLLLNLAFSDLFLGIAITAKAFSSFERQLSAEEEWMRRVKFYSNACACGFTLIAIAVERYLAVVKPFYHKVHVTKKWSYKAIGITWFLTMLCSLPVFVINPLRSIHGTKELGIQSNYSRENTSHVKQDFLVDYRFGYEVFLIFACTVLPALLMSFIYGRIIYRVWLRPNTQGTNTAIMKTRRKLTKLLLTVTVVFYLCWLPLLLNMSNKISIEIKSWLVVFPLLNTVLNPIIYGLHSAPFRQGIKTLCCGCCTRRKVRAVNTDHIALAQRQTTSSKTANNNV